MSGVGKDILLFLSRELKVKSSKRMFWNENVWIYCVKVRIHLIR